MRLGRRDLHGRDRRQLPHPVVHPDEDQLLPAVSVEVERAPQPVVPRGEEEDARPLRRRLVHHHVAGPEEPVDVDDHHLVVSVAVDVDRSDLRRVEPHFVAREGGGGQRQRDPFDGGAGPPVDDREDPQSAEVLPGDVLQFVRPGDRRHPGGASPPPHHGGRQRADVLPFPERPAPSVDRPDPAEGPPRPGGPLLDPLEDGAVPGPDRDERGPREGGGDGRGPGHGPPPDAPPGPPRLQVGQRLGRRRVPVPRLLLQEPRHEGRQPRRRPGAHLPQVGRRRLQVGDQRAEGRIPLQRERAREELVEDDPECVEVGPRVDLAAEGLLRREVLQRPDQPLRLRRPRLAPVPPARQAEVRELHLARRGDEDVPGLHVAVDDAEPVEDVEGAEDLRADPQGLAFPERSPRDEAAEGLSLYQLHRQEDDLAGLADVEDPDEPRAVGVARHRDLPPEPLERGLGRPVRPQHLEGDLALQLAVESGVDDGRASRPEHPADLEAAPDLGPGREDANAPAARPRGRDRIGRRIGPHCSLDSTCDSI